MKSRPPTSIPPRAGPSPTWSLAKLLLAACAALAPAGSYAAGGPAAMVHETLDAACDEASSNLARMADRIPGSRGLAEEPLEARGTQIGWRRRFELASGARISVERLAPGGRTQRLVVEYQEVAPNGGTRPRLAAVADADCAVRLGRRLVYEPDFPQPVAIEHLDRALSPTGAREPLNPAVPDGDDPGGVAVALVDAGVNYLLPEISGRLARDAAGGILGYDYWDRDKRPFDANPARSPFFPQRHGTKTAALLLNEAPTARLVPYRYPRPDMDRMKALVRDAADKGIVIVNMSMGSNERGDWQAFAAAARAHPDMLFVLSAGNNGRDIDARPVYPAALDLDNTITVTSSNADGTLAYGSNWGRQSVDLLVPAERLAVTGFDGSRVSASGSSYAAVRVSALAARLLADHPDWRAAELKAAIFARVLPAFSGQPGKVAQGFIPRPDKAERLPPLADGAAPRQVSRRTIDSDALYADDRPAVPRSHRFTPTFAYFEGTGWALDGLRRHAGRAAAILARCGIVIPRVDVRELEGPAIYRYFHDTIAEELVNRLKLPTPTVYFVRDTLQVEAFDAEAIGKSNSGSRPALRYTIWFTEATRDPGIALAHELAHILMDSGRHVDAAGNLMRGETSPSNTTLTPEQCRVIKNRGTENGLLAPAGDR